MEILANIDSKLLPTGLIKKHDLRVKESGLSGLISIIFVLKF